MTDSPRARLTLSPLEDRWTPVAGDLDPTFGTQGVVRYAAPADNFYAAPNRIASLPDGRVVTADRVADIAPASGAVGGVGVRVSRLTAEGRVDPTFGSGGHTDTLLSTVQALAVQPDGRVLVVGGRADGGFGQGLIRLTADGRLDPTFGTNGVVILLGFTPDATEFSALAV